MVTQPVLVPLKVKFNLIVPCEKEIVIHYEKEFNDNKESFLLACSDENDCQLLLSDYIEEYGIESISDSFVEDSPNREVHSIQSITDDKGNFIYKEKK